jgi:murein DD-endopeptidase MepM/ murein hydrolase activator NlpD
MDLAESALEDLRMRDDNIYRSIFGLNQIPSQTRLSGLGGASRYDEYDEPGMVGGLKNTTMRVDNLLKQAYVQTLSFDEVASESKKAGQMASCVPAIPPVAPDKKRVRTTSPFGYRSDPISGVQKLHSGYDFACKVGNPVYTTGDGVVESVSFDFFGYGNSVLINHGFGYKTRYAHMSIINVAEGMIVKRGDCIGASGNSGKSTGPHLHYEVIYKGNPVNPYPYFDMDMALDEYMALVRKREQESGGMLGTVPRVKKRI